MDLDELLLALSKENSPGFLIARNPFERLVSAYRNKIIGRSKIPNIRRAILAKNRTLTAPRDPTFKEFVSYILDEFHSGQCLDLHWAPVYEVCNPCHVNLTHIIKFETFDRDSSALLQKTNLSHLLLPDRELILPEQNVSVRNQTSASLVDSYLNELTPELLYGLCNCLLYTSDAADE